MDYRCFLKDRVNELKNTKPSFSYRNFNRSAGIKSSGFLKLVIDGKRNLGMEGITKIIKGLRLNNDESSYFENLVKFNQSENHKDKDSYFKRLSQNRLLLKTKPLAALQYELFSNWYYVAILEIVRLDTKDVKDTKWIQKNICPDVSIKDVKIAVKKLKEMKLLSEDKNGNLLRLENMISTPEEVGSVAVVNFHVQMSNLAAKAVIEQEADRREFSSLTIATSEKGFEQVKKEIHNFRQKLHSILEQDKDEKKRVLQINLQVFDINQKEK